jgi:hypothetical protein
VPPLATKGIHGLIDQSSHGRETDRAEPITWMRQRQKLQRPDRSRREGVADRPTA